MVLKAHHETPLASKLYPVYIDTFRVVIVQPKLQFSFKSLLSFNFVDFMGYVTIFVYISFRYASSKLLEDDRSVQLKFIPFSLRIFAEIVGLVKIRLLKFTSTRVAISCLYVFQYMYYMLKMAYILRIMTNGQVIPRLSLLDDIRNSSEEIIITKSLKANFVNVTDLIR